MTAAPCEYRLQSRGGVVTLVLPIKTVSEPNVRSSWHAKAARTKAHRGQVALVLRSKIRALGLPVTVVLTRMSPGRLDDDNLRGALKAVRDGVADALGLRDDSDPRVSWAYTQTRVARGEHAISVIVAPRAGA